MQQDPPDSASSDSVFSVKSRFHKFYFDRSWTSYFNRMGGQSSLAENPRIWMQQYIGGSMWQAVFHELGVPRMTYFGGGNDDEFRLHRYIVGVPVRVLAAEHVSLSGREIRLVEVLEQHGGDRFFDMKVPAGPNVHLEYREQDGYLRLCWDNPPHFEFSNGASDVKNLMLDTFAKTKEILIRKLEMPYSDAMRDVRINMQALPEDHRQYMKIGVLPRAVQGFSLPQNLPPKAFLSNIDLWFNEGSFTSLKTGLAPVDIYWVLTLLFPPRNFFGVNTPQNHGDGFHRLSYMAGIDMEESVVSNAEWLINPVSQIFHAGANRTLLSLTAAVANAQWSLEGETRGTLEKEGTDYYYKAPLVRNPPALFNEDSDLEVAPALRSSVPNPVAVDTIKVTGGNNTVSSTFVTQFVYPTHLIRAALFEGQIKLTLWYWSFLEEKEVQVPEKDVDWQVVAGGGTMSENGVFTSGTLSCCTVLGIDKRAVDDWRWGITIVPYPFIGADNVVNFLEGEANL